MVKKMPMTSETEEKLAAALTAETTELIPFLPYLLQDFWELGINPDIVAELIDRHVSLSESTRILDLACGKGAVSVRLAQRLRVKVKGIDLIPEFIEYAAQKAQEFNVDDLCEFAIGDINDAVEIEKNYDCVIFGAIGAVLGNLTETLSKLKVTVRSGGYLLLDNYDLIGEEQWTALFREAGLKQIEAVPDNCSEKNGNGSFQRVAVSNLGMSAIIKRANELIAKHPDKKKIFEGYISSQQKEYDWLESQNSLDSVTWVLKKV
jgi:SAM-dependent methyltransferase